MITAGCAEWAVRTAPPPAVLGWGCRGAPADGLRSPASPSGLSRGLMSELPLKRSSASQSLRPWSLLGGRRSRNRREAAAIPTLSRGQSAAAGLARLYDDDGLAFVLQYSCARARRVAWRAPTVRPGLAPRTLITRPSGAQTVGAHARHRQAQGLGKQKRGGPFSSDTTLPRGRSCHFAPSLPIGSFVSLRV